MCQQRGCCRAGMEFHPGDEGLKSDSGGGAPHCTQDGRPRRALSAGYFTLWIVCPHKKCRKDSQELPENCLCLRKACVSWGLSCEAATAPHA